MSWVHLLRPTLDPHLVFIVSLKAVRKNYQIKLKLLTHPKLKLHVPLRSHIFSGTRHGKVDPSPSANMQYRGQGYRRAAHQTKVPLTGLMERLGPCATSQA